MNVSKEEPIAIRKRWYSPSLQDSSMLDEQPELLEPDDEHPYNLVSSLCEDGFHRPALDIDIPVQLVPSSTEGHFHLYFPATKLTWEEYLLLLKALADAGIIEQNYLKHAMRRKQTTLRPPHVKKERKAA